MQRSQTTRLSRARNYVFLAYASLLAALAPVSANAALSNPLGSVTIPELAGRIIKAALGISGSLALLMFIWGGFLWLTAAGKPERIKSGQNTLLWAVIGLVVIFGAYSIVNFIITQAAGVAVEPAST